MSEYLEKLLVDATAIVGGMPDPEKGILLDALDQLDQAHKALSANNNAAPLLAEEVTSLRRQLLSRDEAGVVTKILHVSGFIDSDAKRPSSVKIATYDGPLHEIASGVLAGIAAHDHKITTSTLRTLDGWLVEVRAYVEVGDEEMWHIFTTASEPWAMAPVESSEPATKEG